MRAGVHRLPGTPPRRSAASPARGFTQMMKGLETGRIQVAARAPGGPPHWRMRWPTPRPGRAGQPIWATSVDRQLSRGHGHHAFTAARQLTRYAAERYGQRRALRHGGAGMAKLFASEAAIALNAVRIHGGYGYSTEYDVERYFRCAADDRGRGHQRDSAQCHRGAVDHEGRNLAAVLRDQTLLVELAGVGAREALPRMRSSADTCSAPSVPGARQAVPRPVPQKPRHGRPVVPHP